MKTTLILALSLFTLNAQAKGLVFSDATIIAPLKGSTVTAGYGKIKNDSDQEVKVSIIDGKPFDAVEIHETVESGGKMAMNQLDEIKIAAHQSFEFKPGANHIMLFDPSKPIQVGNTITLRFKVNGKTESAKFKVVKRD